MTTDPLHLLEGVPVPPAPQPTWEPLDLSEFDDDVRVVDTFDDDYQPPTLVEPEPEPARLRHRQTWAERHRSDVDDLRLTLGQATMNLRYVADGCRAVNYHPEVTEQVTLAIERVTEALRLIDIHDPE